MKRIWALKESRKVEQKELSPSLLSLFIMLRTLHYHHNQIMTYAICHFVVDGENFLLANIRVCLSFHMEYHYDSTIAHTCNVAQ